MKKTITLDIAGASYRMNVDADEEHLRRLAEIVNERVAAMGPKAASGCWLSASPTSPMMICFFRSRRSQSRARRDPHE